MRTDVNGSTGLIQNERDDVIRLVKSMVEDNIKHEETVILLNTPATGKSVQMQACQMTDGHQIDDIQTVQAFKLARQTDPDGKRTIGTIVPLSLSRST